MSTTATEQGAPAAQSAKRSAALFSVLAALGITALKLLTGLLTGSLGMLSEAAHSSIDLVAATITLFSVQVADRPADEDHNYGHGKIESLSAFVETVLMVASCLWIVTEAARRLLLHHQRLSLKLSVWPFVVLLLSIAVDYKRSRTLSRAARTYRSPALQADAIHFRTDIWSSAAVLLGLTATWLGERLHLPALEAADPLAALLVSAIILRTSWQLARQTIDTLLDATPTQRADGSPANIRREIVRALAAIDGVLTVDRLRVRQSGPRYFADVTLGMPRNLTFQRTEQITAAATRSLQHFLPEADVVVHPLPIASSSENLHDRVRAVAARANLAIHDVTLQQHGNALHLEQHLEVDERMPLRQAHDLVTQLEADVRRDVPEISSILTHIESEPATIEQPASLEQDRRIEQRLRRIAASIPGVLDIHDIVVTRVHNSYGDLGGVQVTCHCTLADDAPMARVHAVITQLESAFKRDEPEVVRLLIHPEPVTDNRR